MALAPIPFFTDQNIPDSVGRAIAAAGHELERLRDCMPITAKDPLIAIACARGGQVLVSQDNDFKAIAERLRISQNKHARMLHRVDIRCDAVVAAIRLRDMMSLIEHEWTQARILGIAMLVELGNEFVRIRR
jgi:predicted nuclease of predicted toxin-antitoxin system